MARRRPARHGDGFTREAIRDRSECPDCGVPAGVVCDRSRDPYPAGLCWRLEAGGTSHYRRMLAAYGVPEPKWDWYVARNEAGVLAPSARSVQDIAQGEVNCPIHASAVRGEPCPEGGACAARVKKAAAVAVRRQARAERRRRARKVIRCTVPARPTSSFDVLEPVNGPGRDTGFRRWWCLVMFPPTRELAVSGPDGRAALKRAARRT